MYILAAAFLFLLPFQLAMPLQGEDIPLARLFGLLLLVCWIAHVFIKSNDIHLPKHVFFPLVGFLGWVVVSLSLQDTLSSDWFRKLIFLAGLYPLSLVWAWFFDRGQEYGLMKALVCGGTLSALMALVLFFSQFWFGVEKTFSLMTEHILPPFLGRDLSSMVANFPSLLVNIGGETWLRVTGFFPDPHVAAYFFGMVGFLALGIFMERKEKLWLFMAGVLFLADLLTFSRGGYLGAFAGGTLVLFFVLKQQGFGIRGISFVAGIPVFLWLLWPVVERFFSSFLFRDASSIDRFELWKTAFATFVINPWFGVGLGQYAELMFPFRSAGLPYYAHNLYFDIAVECGSIGLLFFIWYVGGALRIAISRAFQSSQAIGVAAGLLAYGVHSLFETALFSLHVAVILSFFVALAWKREARLNAESV